MSNSTFGRKLEQRLILLTIKCLFITGCALRPIDNSHQATSDFQNHLSQIALQPIESIEGVEFYNEMRGLLAPCRGDQYLLKVTLTYAASHSIIQKNSDVIRENEKLSVQYALVDQASNKTITSGRFQKLSSYSTIFTSYFDDVRSQSVKQNLATTAAAELRNRLILFFVSKS